MTMPCATSLSRTNSAGGPSLVRPSPEMSMTCRFEAKPEFSKRWATVRLGSRNPYDVLRVASMIERETKAPEERKLVSAVIWNRLAKGMPLGIDATLRYGLGIQGTRPLTAVELRNQTPYNTSVHKGLPPTPIGNPGLPSMQAAAHPAKVPFLYFVRKADCKSHFFTASAQAFLNYPRAGLRC